MSDITVKTMDSYSAGSLRTAIKPTVQVINRSTSDAGRLPAHSVVDRRRGYLLKSMAIAENAVYTGMHSGTESA